MRHTAAARGEKKKQNMERHAGSRLKCPLAHTVWPSTMPPWSWSESACVRACLQSSAVACLGLISMWKLQHFAAERNTLIECGCSGSKDAY